MTSLKQKRFVDTEYFHKHLDSTMVEVEGSYISATDTKIGTITDLEILGNTVQDSENLADIRSLGTDNGDGTYSYEIVTKGKNLLGELETGRWEVTNGLPTVAHNYVRTKDYIKVQPLIKLCGQYKYKGTLRKSLHVTEYDKDYNFIKDTYSTSGTFTLSSPNTSYITVTFYCGSLSTHIPATDITEAQLEEGSIVTEYEPYKESRTKITLPCQLEKVYANSITGYSKSDRLYYDKEENAWCIEKYIDNIYVNSYQAYGQHETLKYYWITGNPVDIVGAEGISELGQVNIVTNGSIMRFAQSGDMFATMDEFLNRIKLGVNVKYPLDTPQKIVLPKDTQIALNSFLGTTHIFFEGTEVEGTIKAKISKSVGGTLESLVEKAKITDDRLELIENVAEGQNMQYSTDNGIIHCKNTKKGKVKDLVIEGNTLVNYAKDGSKTLTLNGEIDEKGTFITTTEAVNNGLVDVAIEGETLVNVCNQKDPIAITKSYTVENTNHVPLQGEYDGKCRPVVEGKTLVNLVSNYRETSSYRFTDNGDDTYTYDYSSGLGVEQNVYASFDLHYNFKDNTTYTFITTIKENSLVSTSEGDSIIFPNGYTTGQRQQIPYNTKGLVITKVTTNKNSAQGWDTNGLEFVIGKDITGGKITITKPMIFEGDLTANPPTEYIEGLKSSFEDQLVTDEEDPNYGKYKVEYKVTGKNKLNINSSPDMLNYCTAEVSGNSITLTQTKVTSSGVMAGWIIPTKLGVDYTFKGAFNNPNNSAIYLRCRPVNSTNSQWNTHTTTSESGNLTLKVQGTGEDIYFMVYLKVSEAELQGTIGNTVTWSNLQVEEGTVATEYEAYKEYTKTFYLNSPLLEGDTIEDVNDKATHVRRSEKIVLDGSREWQLGVETQFTDTHMYFGTTSIDKTCLLDSPIICDRFNNSSTWWKNSYECIDSVLNTIKLRIRILKSRLATQDVEGFKNWLSENPTTVIYQLASPIYETISEESILCDSYVNGHLDVNTNIPISKVKFTLKGMNLKYIQPNTKYIVQFESDSIGKLDNIRLGEWSTAHCRDLPVVKGFNRFEVTTTNNLTAKFIALYGIGFTASNISVVATEREFNYFEGLSSVGQDDVNGHNIKITSRNKNLFDKTKLSQGQFVTFNGKECYKYVDGPTSETWFKYKDTFKQNTQYTIKVNSYREEEFNTSKYVYKFHIHYTDGTLSFYYLEPSREYTLTSNVGKTISSIEGGWHYVQPVYMDLTTFQIEESSTATSYVAPQTNTKTLSLKEPLRSLPNAKDKIVKIGGKWYIERNCAEYKITGEETINIYRSTNPEGTENTNAKTIQYYITGLPNMIVGTQTVNGVCDKYPSIASENRWEQTSINTMWCGNSHISFMFDKELNYGTTDVRPLIKGITVVYQLATPTYEELEVEPVLTTYVGQTHISTNSVIPCDMTVKNSGYDTIIKPSTLYTVALETSGEVELNLGGSKVTTNNGVAKVITPSTLVDDSLRISGKGLKSSNVRVLEGDNTHYIPSYFEGLKSSFDEMVGDKYLVEVESSVKGNLFNPNTVELGYWSTDSKTYLTNIPTTFSTKVPIRVKPNTDYTIQSLNTTGNVYVVGLNPFKSIKVVNNSSATFNTGQYSQIYIQVNVTTDGVDKIENYLSRIKLEEGNVRTEYTPYISNKMQFSTLAPLRSVGDVKDRVVYKDNKWMIERNLGQVTLDGSENWTKSASGAYYGNITTGYYIPMDNITSNTNGLFNGLLCNLLPSARHSSMSVEVGDGAKGIFINNSRIYIRTNILTLEEFKQWLSENPTTVVYELAEPTYEEIEEYRNLDSYDEGTTISTNSFIAPSHLGFKLSSHVSNIVKDMQDDVSDLKTWRSEIFDSITHTKTFDSGFTTVEDTKEGIVNEVKIQGRTLVNKYLQPTTNSYETTDKVVFAHDRGYILNTKHCYDVRDWDKTITVISTTGRPIYLEWLTLINDDTQVKWGGMLSNSFVVQSFVLPKECSSISVGGYKREGWTLEKATSSNIVILEGDYTNNPPSFFEGLMSVGEDVEGIVIKSVNENLFDLTDICNTPLYTNDKAYKWYVFKGKPNTVYTINANTNVSSRLKYYFKITKYDYSDTIGWLAHGTQGNIKDTFTFTTDSLGRIGIAFNNIGNSSVNFYEELKKFTIYEGNTNKPYTPHKSDKKTLLYYNENGELLPIPQLHEWDSIEKHSDGKYYYHKRSGKVVLNGSESWTTFIDLGSTGRSYVENKSFNVGGEIYNNCISDILENCTNFGTDGNNGIWCNNINNRIGINIDKSKLSTNDIEGFKSWLQANNVTVVYQLAQEEVYEVANLELNSYDGETNIIVNSGAISPITTVSLTSSLPQVAENLRNRVKQLEEQMYDYQVVQNLRQLRTFYKSDYANFGIAVVTNTLAVTSSEDITPYGYDLFELFKQIIEEGKDSYDRIELEEYIDFYVMTFIFDFEMAFELFDLIASQHPHSEIEEEEPTIKEEEDLEIDVEMGVIPEEIDPEMGVIPQEPSDEDFEIDVEMGVEHEDFEIDVEMGVVPLEPNTEEDLED